MGNPILVIILGLVAVGSAIAMLLSRNAVHAALFLVLNFITIAILYLVLNAPFLFVTQITVYAGAIMVLFLFVVMLLGAEQLRGVSGGSRWQWVVSIVLGLVLVGTFIRILTMGLDTVGAAAETAVDAGPASIGLALFESYVFPFEIASIVLLVAMVGVVVLRSRKGKNA
ncbi:MAG: NADH-quinone oxidoreductase subunit J [Candidatus Promineifilaceae bacterium]